MNVFGYTRVSTPTQEKEGYSLDEQKERIESYCKAMGWTLLNVFVDAGESGAKRDRPALQQMITQINQVQKVVVYKLDRLSRSQKDTLYLIEDVFLKNGVDFVSMTENFDTSTPFGKAMIGILAVFAQLEREQIKERMNMGKLARVKGGRYVGQDRTAIGYEYVGGDLKIIPSEAEQVRMVFEKLTEKKSFSQIAEEMNAAGYSHRYGVWNKTTVRNITRNEVYVGKVSFGKVYYDGTHEPIISKELFEEAAKVAQKRTEEYTTQLNPGRATSYLAGLLRCKCGQMMYKRRDSCVTHSRYVCQARSRGLGCKLSPRWKEKELDEVVLNEVRKLALDPPEPKPVQQIDNSAEIAKLDKQISRLVDLYSTGMFDIETLQEKTAELNRRKLALMNVKKETQPDFAAVRSFDDLIKHGTLQQVRAVLTDLIEYIEVGTDVEIHWRF